MSISSSLLMLTLIHPPSQGIILFFYCIVTVFPLVRNKQSVGNMVWICKCPPSQRKFPPIQHLWMILA